MISIGRAYTDFAGGKILDGCQSVLVNDMPVARVGSNVADHGLNEHNAAKMITGSPSVMVENIPVCRTGDSASCGHPLISNSNVEAG